MSEMNDQNPAPETSIPEASAPASSSEASIIDELKTMGERLAAALKAAANTPEADSVKSDVRDGLQQLRGELDKALDKPSVQKVQDSVQSNVQRGSEVAGTTTRKVRIEAAGFLREANKALDRLAASLEGRGTDGGDATPPDDTSNMGGN